MKQTVSTPNTCYSLIKKRVTREFVMGKLFIQRILSRYVPSQTITSLLDHYPAALDSLIPKIPYIGGKDNIFTSYLIAPVIFIPIVRMLKEKGHPLRQTGQILFEIMEMGYNSMPAPIRWATRMGYFSEKRKEKYRQGSARSLKRQYPEDWVYDYIEGNGSNFHFGLIIKECGIFKFWKKQGLEEFTPYLCLSDWILWKALGIQVKRTQTIANGGDHCDFFYIRKKKRVPRGWPPETLPEWTGRYEK